MGWGMSNDQMKSKKNPSLAADQKKENPAHRPTIYDEEMANYICDLISISPYSLVKIYQKHERFPHPDTIYRWANKYPEFFVKYMQARKLQAHCLVDSMLDDAQDISAYYDADGIERIDAGKINKAKTVIATKQWQSGRLNPKIFGATPDVTLLADENIKLKQEAQALREQLQEQYKRDH